MNSGKPLFLWILVFFIIFSARQLAVAASFDCNATNDQISKTICSDESLSQQDTHMAELYGAYIQKMTKQYDEFRQAIRASDAAIKMLPQQIHKAKIVQASWLALSRGTCSQEALPDLHDQIFCLQKVYNKRISQLEIDVSQSGYEMPSGDQILGNQHWKVEKNNDSNLCNYVKKYNDLIPDNEHASLVPMDKLHIYNPSYNHDMSADNIQYELDRYQRSKDVHPAGGDRLGGLLYMTEYDYNNSGNIGILMENRYQSHMTGANQEDYFVNDFEELAAFPTWNAIMQSPAMLDPLKNASQEIRSYIGGGYDHEWGYTPFRYKGMNYFHGVLINDKREKIWIFRFISQTETKTECLFHN